MNCKVCEKEVKVTFIPESGSWLGTKKPKGNPKLFRKSEFDFGWDYYPNQDLKLLKCDHCGYEEYVAAYE